MTRISVSVSFILVIIVGFLDYYTGYNISFMMFYLAPISLAAWAGGLRAGILCAVLSGFVWLLADLMAGHPYAYWLTPIWNLLGRILLFLSPVFLLELISINKQQKVASLKDGLTGIWNRKGLMERMSVELERSRRYKHPFTFVFLDCDNFKDINDQHGHAAGDGVLRAVGKTLKRKTRASDIVARIGGDEFIMFFPETDFDSSRVAIKKLEKALLESMKAGRWPVTFSIGAITYRSFPLKVEDMLKESDELMYLAKNNGKNTIEHKIYEKETLNPAGQ